MPLSNRGHREPSREDERWHPGSNWGMGALQAPALPLGYATEDPEFYLKPPINIKELLPCSVRSEKRIKLSAVVWTKI